MSARGASRTQSPPPRFSVRDAYPTLELPEVADVDPEQPYVTDVDVDAAMGCAPEWGAAVLEAARGRYVRAALLVCFAVKSKGADHINVAAVEDGATTARAQDGVQEGLPDVFIAGHASAPYRAALLTTGPDINHDQIF